MKRISLILGTALAIAALAPTGASAIGVAPTVKIGLPVAGSFAKTLPSLSFSTTGSAVTKTCTLSGPGDRYEYEEPCNSPYRPGEAGADGTYTYSVTATNTDGSDTKSVSFIVDQTAPTVQFTSAPPEGLVGNATIIAFKASYSDANVNTVTCRVDSEPPAACGGGGVIQQQYTNVGEGMHKFSVSVTDKAGNVGYIERNITIDRTAPSASIVLVGGGGESNDNTPAFQIAGADANGPITKQCRIENQIDWVACSGDTWVTPDAIADGLVTAWVAVSDRAGNTGYASYAFALDATMPTISFTGLEGDTTTSGSPSVAFTTADPNKGAVRCGFDPSGWESLTACADGSHTPTVPLALGSHQFWISASDTLGNSASYIYSFDVVAPTVPGGGQGGDGQQGSGSAKPVLTVSTASGKVRRGRFTVRLELKTTNAKTCGRADVVLAPKVKRTRPLAARAKTRSVEGACLATVKIKLAAKYKRKTATLNVTQAGATKKLTIRL